MIRYASTEGLLQTLRFPCTPLPVSRGAAQFSAHQVSARTVAGSPKECAATLTSQKIEVWQAKAVKDILSSTCSILHNQVPLLLLYCSSIPTALQLFDAHLRFLSVAPPEHDLEFLNDEVVHGVVGHELVVEPVTYDQLLALQLVPSQG